MNERTVKQNRVMTAALIILIASLVALIALTAGANRKSNPVPDPEPPVGRRAAEEESASPAPVPDKQAKKKPADDKQSASAPETEKLDEVLKPDAKKTDKPERDTASVPTSAAADELPRFRIPLENGAAVKGCSLTVPVFSATMDDYRTHNGIDFACAPGTPVLAAADGTVASVGKDPMMGWTITLHHAGGAVTKYRGLAEESCSVVKAGDKVLAGEVIGASGETALIESAEENHLHFEMAVNGKPVDPADYMDVVMLSDLTED